MNRIQQKDAGKVMSGMGSIIFLVSLFFNFNRALLIISDILFICGIFFILGKNRSMHLFFYQNRIPATILLIFGLLFIVFDRGGLGCLLQLFGAFLMFGGFIPFFLNEIKKIPIICDLFRNIKTDEELLPK